MVVVNGQPTDLISVHDRGLQYGDGLFETIAVIDGKAQHWELHMLRLARGCERLSIPFPGTEQLAADVDALAIDHQRHALKIIVTRGASLRGYRPPDSPQTTRIVYSLPWPDYPATNAEHGVTVRLCSGRLSSNPQTAGIKHLNRLEQVLARGEWGDPAIVEGLMLDNHGNLVEATMSNVFLVANGHLHTPDLSSCGVAGIMREIVLRECRSAAIAVHIRTITWDDVWQADELFLTNSLIGLWPVRRLVTPQEQRDFAAPTLTRELRARLRDSLPDHVA